MRRWALFLLPFLLAACSGGFYKISKEEYRERVQTLGVLPLMVDENSTITHPEREEVISLLRRSAAGKEGRLVEIIKEQKGYFDVRPISGPPEQLFRRLVASSTLRGKGSDTFRHYQLNPAAIAELTERNVVDALLVVILNGVTRLEKRWDRDKTSLNYLEAQYNAIQVTAVVVLPSGEIVWEYPGASGTFLPLQYPDFDEAYYNKVDEVKIKYITLAGLGRYLSEPEKGLFGRSKFPRLYKELFDGMASALKPGLLHPVKSPGT